MDHVDITVFMKNYYHDLLNLSLFDVVSRLTFYYFCGGKFVTIKFYDEKEKG
jgi:hypothetical protein